MLKLATSILALASALNPQLTEQDYAQLWGQFTQHFRKEYADDMRSTKFAVFKDNIQFINEWNAAKNSSVVLAVNEFTDLTTEEFFDSYSGYRAPPMFRNADVHPTTVFPVEQLSTLPSSVDWTSVTSRVAAVKNQGGCSASYAFTATAAVESAFAIRNGSLSVLAEQEILDCAVGNYGCYGGSVEPAFTYAQQFGLCLSKDYQYHAVVGLTCSSDACHDKVKILGFNTVKSGDEIGMRRAVFRQPVAASFRFHARAIQFYSSGLLNDSTCTSAELDHTALVVGFGSEEDGQDYWKIKNSWGESWGMSGFALVARGEGACGVASQVSYPIV